MDEVPPLAALVLYDTVHPARGPSIMEKVEATTAVLQKKLDAQAMRAMKIV